MAHIQEREGELSLGERTERKSCVSSREGQLRGPNEYGSGFALDALKVILGTKIGSLRKHSMAPSVLIKLID